jgi:hypothetical protein
MLDNLKNRVARIVDQVEQSGRGTEPTEPTEADVISMLEQQPKLAAWLKYCLYHAGYREAMGFVDAVPDAELTKQLAASAELRARVTACLLKAEEWCEHGYSESIRQGRA